MPVAEEDRLEVGVLGLEATHRWEHGLTVLPALTLNARGAWPRFLLGKINGLHSAPGRESSPLNRVGKIGTTATPDRLQSKSVVYEGVLFGRTLAEARLGRLQLLTAFSVQTARTMRVTPHEDYAGGTEHVYTAVPQTIDCDDDQGRSPTAQPTPFGREFVLSLRLDDPRTYRPDAVAVTGSTVAIEGGFAPTDFIATVPNPGSSITIAGARGTLHVIGLTPGVAAIVDTVRGQITQAGEAAGLVAADSTMLDAPSSLPEGDSSLTITGAASMTVTYRKAYW